MQRIAISNRVIRKGERWHLNKEQKGIRVMGIDEHEGKVHGKE